MTRAPTVKQSIAIGGNATGVIQTAGGGNTITQAATATFGTPPEVLQALDAIRAALAANPHTRVLADAAAEQAKVKNPDKGAIATQLDRALTVAKTIPDWMDVAGKIAPHVTTAAAWLGAQGNALLALLR